MVSKLIVLGISLLFIIQGIFLYFTFFQEDPNQTSIEGKVIEPTPKETKSAKEENEIEEPSKEIPKENLTKEKEVNDSKVNLTSKELKVNISGPIELKLKDMEVCGADGGNMLVPSIADCIAGKMKRYYPNCVWYCDNWTSQCDKFFNNSVRDCFYKNCDPSQVPSKEKPCT